MDARAIVATALVSGLVGLLLRGAWDRSGNVLQRWVARPAEPDRKSAGMISARWSEPKRVDEQWQAEVQIANASHAPILATKVRTPQLGDLDLGAASSGGNLRETTRLPDGKTPPLHVEFTLDDNRWRLTDAGLESLETEVNRTERLAATRRATLRRALLGGTATLAVIAYMIYPLWSEGPAKPPPEDYWNYAVKPNPTGRNPFIGGHYPATIRELNMTVTDAWKEGEIAPSWSVQPETRKDAPTDFDFRGETQTIECIDPSAPLGAMAKDSFGNWVWTRDLTLRAKTGAPDCA